MRRLARFFALIVLALGLGAQGAFAGTTVCREADGAVSLEWGQGGRCETAPGAGAVTCLKDGAEADHCMQCLDVPVPSDVAAKSLAVAAPLVAVTALAPAPDFSLAASPAASVHDVLEGRVAFDGARTVRLLI